MKQTERRRNNSNSSNNTNKKNKLSDINNILLSNNVNRSNFCQLEDLSNELIYEIFDYLDNYHVYQSFYYLNKRFENLLINSIIPMKINISSISKSNYDDYYLKIIKPNKHRITSLYLSNIFIIDIHLFSPIIISQLIRLETLILNHIEFKSIEIILKYAISLPNLSSLTIHPIDDIKNSNDIYYTIFRLPYLKYCKISGYTINNEFLSNINNEFSSIEYIIIESSLNLDKLQDLLSYIPQLRYFSINCLNGIYSKKEEICRMTSNNLKYLSIKYNQIYFIQFKKLIENFFSGIEELHIIAEGDRTYINANQWEQLISSHMLNLRVFNMNYIDSIYSNELSSEHLAKSFNSKFWNDRKTIFMFHKTSLVNIDIKIFYSIDLTKKFNYKSFKITDTNNYLLKENISRNSVKHIYLCSEKALNNCQNYFPNVKNLTFDHRLYTIYHPSVININRIIPLLQIKELVIECFCISIREIIDILCYTPNLNTLKCYTQSFIQAQSTLVQQSESYKFVSNTNNIKNVNFIGKCSLKHIKSIIGLFPRLEQLTLEVDKNDIDSYIQFILSKNNNNTSKLFFLCIPAVPELCLQEVKKLIKSEKLLDNYLIKYINQNLYLWW